MPVPSLLRWEKGSNRLKEVSNAVDTPTVEAPPVPADDLLRVGSLRRLGLLDTEPEERFDRITRIARRLFGVDTALVSLVDIDRQWAKSRQCMASLQALEVLETPRDLSFCGHAILGHEVLQVQDTAIDPRFSDNPLVVGQPAVRFYAGCPIASPEGAMIGTLCLLDERPRMLSADDLLALRDLAAMVEHEIAVTRLAIDDELTGLANRRGFNMIGTQALAFCQRQQVDALVVVATIDGLDEINERGGRAAGDQLIRMAAAAMADTFRSSDVVGRVGGRRFAAVLTGYEGSETRVADRLRSAVAASNLELQRTTFGLSMTVGSARFNHRDPELLEVLMHRAKPRRSADQRHRQGLDEAEAADEAAGAAS
jgi:diguanylate cyclase (GGDEF)-like protein